MRVDHLYVFAICLALDGDQDKKLETERTARALFRRHSAKAKSAALIEVRNMYYGNFDARILQTHGEPRLGAAISGESSAAASRSALSKSGLSPANASADADAESMETVGMYLVFHSDNGGMVFMPEDGVGLITGTVPPGLHKSIQKVSLFACDIAGYDEGEPIESVFGRSIKEAHRGLVGGNALMVQLLQQLNKSGIRPMVCGYDIPVFAGDGPIKNESPARGVKRLRDGKWIGAKLDDADVYGRKLVIYKDGRQSLTPIKDKVSENANYRTLHKKVLRVNDDGTIADGLAGWSSKD